MSKTRLKRRQAELAGTEAALATPCPACKVAPGVWCGPVLERTPLHQVEPWMHNQRYATAHVSQHPLQEGGSHEREVHRA